MQTKTHRKAPALLALAPLFFALPIAIRAELPPLPQPATSFGASVSEGSLYIYGGNTGKAHEFNTECIKGDFFRLKLPDGTAWEKLLGGDPLLGAPMIAHGGYVYRIGGLQARNPKGQKDDLHSTTIAVRFNTKNNAWEKLPELPDARSSHDVAIVGDTLYVGGGWRLKEGNKEGENGEWQKTVLTLDLKAPEKGWSSFAQPFQRRALAMVAIGDRIWFMGGMDQKDEPSRLTDWYDTKTQTWGKGPILPEGMLNGFGMAACASGGKLIVSPLSGKVLTLSANGEAWEEITQLSKPRFFHRIVPLAEGKVLAVGGSSRKGQIPEVEVVALDGSKAAAKTAEAAPATATETASATPAAEQGEKKN